MFRVKGFCRYCGYECSSLMFNKQRPCISKCKKAGEIISKTTPKGGNIKSPSWCPKNK